MRKRLPWRRLGEALALVAVVYFVGAYLLRHAREVRSHRWSFEAAELAGATTLVVIALVGFGVLWARLLAASGERVSVRTAVPVWFLSNLARYAPGKVWQISGMAYLARRRGLRAFHAVGASVLLQVLVVATGALLVGGLLPREMSALYGWPAEAALLAGGLLVAAFFLSPLFDRSVAALAHRLGGSPGETRLPLRRKIAFGAGTAAAWVAYGLGFWLFLRGSVGHAPPPEVACGIFAAGYLAGFMAFFTPGGLGVREGAFVVLLQPYLSAPVALAAALLSRVWLTLLEVVLAGASALAAGDVEAAPGTGVAPGSARGGE